MRTRLAIALTLMAVAGGSGAAAASGAVVSGSNLAGAAPPTWLSCGSFGSCTLAIADLPLASRAPGGARAVDGVIVSWRVRTGGVLENQAVRLRLIREDVGDAAGATVTLPKAAGTYEFQERLRVKGGDRLGIDLVDAKGAGGIMIGRSASGASFQRWSPMLSVGEFRAPTETVSSYELLLNATIEPDADADGFGDETQDRCPGRADASNACAVVPGPIPTEAVPNTKVSEVKVEGGKATFRFSATVKGAKFRCKLDKKPWKSCKSPKVYRGLKEGRHSFKVKAIGPTAVPDPTPAKRTFRVKL